MRTPALSGLKIDSNGKSYRLGAVGVAALRDINLEIRSGRLTVISGASGSGKSTLLNLIGCIDKPDSGRLIVAGQDIARLSDDAQLDFRVRHLGFIFQGFNLIPVLTAYENVEYPLVLANAPKAQRARRVTELLNAVGLADKAKHRPRQLSGGQRQRVAVAASPRIVLADEPTANLDSHTGAAIIALMRRLQQEQGVSFVISPHDPQVLATDDDVVRIADGRIVDACRGLVEREAA
ncbi:ABC transporter ATP-binding protein [Cupriavidus necator]|uniref:ABC transporter ATP-binding protein n=1 Tax=Cupriavidus necator TaxID=106590 RepID=UPI00339D41E6